MGHPVVGLHTIYLSRTFVGKKISKNRLLGYQRPFDLLYLTGVQVWEGKMRLFSSFLSAAALTPPFVTPEPQVPEGPRAVSAQKLRRISIIEAEYGPFCGNLDPMTVSNIFVWLKLLVSKPGICEVDLIIVR